MEETRTRLGSVDANYYPSLDQILSAHDDDLNKFLSKTKKANIVCLFRELLVKFNENESIQNDLDAIKSSIKKRTMTLQDQQCQKRNQQGKPQRVATSQHC